MKTFKKLDLYKHALEVWLQTPPGHTAREPRPEDFQLTTPAERVAADSVRRFLEYDDTPKP